MSKKVVVIGGGAAGMAAAYFAAKNGHQVTLVEQNEKLGKKLFITGKGRCNLTNDCVDYEYFNHLVSNPKFMYSAFYSFTNDDVVRLLQSAGLRTKVERGGRVFPESDHSSDVIKAWEKLLQEAGVYVLLHTRITKLVSDGEQITELYAKGRRMGFDHVILATGGLSYEATGSTGDGHRFCESMGVSMTKCIPALVPLTTEESAVYALSGLSLKNVGLTVLNGTKKVYEDFGEMLFTHFGLSGPIILSASLRVTDLLHEGKELTAVLDLKPALSKEQLEERFMREFSGNENKKLKNVFASMLPSSMIEFFFQKAGISSDTFVRDLKKQERDTLIDTMKALRISINGTRGFSEAIITKGGVSVKEIDPQTMKSRKIKNLSFAGELCDLQAETGGYNLQIAWSTGALAGKSIE